MFRTYDAQCQRIGKNQRTIQDLMRGPPYSDTKRRTVGAA